MSDLTPEQQATANRNSADLARQWQQVADHQRDIIHQAHDLLDQAGVPRVQLNPTNANDLIDRLERLIRLWESTQRIQEQIKGVGQVLYEVRPNWTYVSPVQAASALASEVRSQEQRIERLRAALQFYAAAGAIGAQQALENDHA